MTCCLSINNNFTQRSTVNLGGEILKIKYSYDNQLLLVVRNSSNAISVYDGRTFVLLELLYLPGNIPPVDF